MKERLLGWYATRIYLPLSGWSRRWRIFSRRIRNKPGRFLQATALPAIAWTQCTRQRSFGVWAHHKANGNVRISELGILSALAADCRPGSTLFEIGTFDGRTTLNLALNSPASCQVVTLDLPPSVEPVFALAQGERHMVEKPRPGARYEQLRERYPAAVAKIRQLLGDSAAFDHAPYDGRCSLVFVDGSHSHDYVLSDSRAAMAMVHEGGVVLWHDYGIWPGVTDTLETLARQQGHRIVHLAGTSLACWRK